MTERNAKAVLTQLNQILPHLFDSDCVLLHREHVRIVGYPKPWSSVKPVNKWFPDRDVVVVDDSIEKADSEEKMFFKNILTWDGQDQDEKPLLRLVIQILSS